MKEFAWTSTFSEIFDTVEVVHRHAHKRAFSHQLLEKGLVSQREAERPGGRRVLMTSRGREEFGIELYVCFHLLCPASLRVSATGQEFCSLCLLAVLLMSYSQNDWEPKETFTRVSFRYQTPHVSTELGFIPRAGVTHQWLKYWISFSIILRLWPKSLQYHDPALSLILNSFLYLLNKHLLGTYCVSALSLAKILHTFLIGDLV